jgi:hypothetical protein
MPVSSEPENATRQLSPIQRERLVSIARPLIEEMELLGLKSLMLYCDDEREAVALTVFTDPERVSRARERGEAPHG